MTQLFINEQKVNEGFAGQFFSQMLLGFDVILSLVKKESTWW